MMYLARCLQITVKFSPIGADATRSSLNLILSTSVSHSIPNALRSCFRWARSRNFFFYACSGQFRAATVFNKLICWVLVKYYGLG